MSWNAFGMQPGMTMQGPMQAMPMQGMNGAGMGNPRPVMPTAGVDGAWKCHACNNVNYAMRMVCNRCGAPKDSADKSADQRTEQVSQHSAQMLHGTHRRTNGEPIEGMDGNWACKSCGNVNFAKRDICNRCSFAKPTPEELAVRAQQLVEERKKDLAAGYAPRGFEGMLGFEHLPTNPEAPQPERQVRTSSGPPTVGGPDGNWACPSCGNVNYPKRDKCNRCGYPKPAMTALVQQQPQQPYPMYDDGSGQMYPMGMGNDAQLAMYGNLAPQPTQPAQQVQPASQGQESVLMLQTRIASLEASLQALQGQLVPQVAQISLQLQQTNAVVQQQARLLAMANLINAPADMGGGASAPDAASAMGLETNKRKAAGVDAGLEQPAKRQEA